MCDTLLEDTISLDFIIVHQLQIVAGEDAKTIFTLEPIKCLSDIRRISSVSGSPSNLIGIKLQQGEIKWSAPK